MATGRPIDRVVRERVRRLLAEDPDLSVRELAKRAGTSRSTAHRLMRGEGPADTAPAGRLDAPQSPERAGSDVVGTPMAQAASQPSTGEPAPQPWPPPIIDPRSSREEFERRLRDAQQAAYALTVTRNPHPMATHPDWTERHPADIGLRGWLRPYTWPG